MQPVKQAAAQFLTCRRIAVTGVSRNRAGHGSNTVYQRLRSKGYEVFAINPNAQEVEGDPCYPDLASVPGGVEAVVIATHAKHAEQTMRECVDLGIRQVWMHRSTGAGSVSDVAAVLGRQNDITVIDGGCPLMFKPVSDPGHRVMCLLLTLTGKIPRKV
ncbi:MAG: uncharacterized protein QG608_1517 [Actinomycetota bacterium]|nr:uncharacterized protein [Actinomycetota bacterium]